MRMSLNVFDVQRSIECWGLWYALWRYGPRQSWTIFVAWRLAVRDARHHEYVQLGRK